MATQSLALARTAFATTIGDLYTVPTNTATAVVTNIVVVNTGSTAQTFNIDLDGVELFNDTPIAGNSTISIDMKQVLDAQPTNPTKKIRGFASSTAVKVHISGVEIE
jgi:hypothetical protein